MSSARPEELTKAQARRIALAAQGFCDRPHARPTLATLARTVARTGVLQVDSVNVLQRAHYLPLYSRMGSYDPELLHRASEVNTASRPRLLVEYWAHVQALMPVELWPVMRHRMDSIRTRRDEWFTELPDLDQVVLDYLREHGASTARELAADLARDAVRRKEHWGWNWSGERQVLDFLYRVGDVAIAGRNQQFEIRYDLPERVIPAAILAQPALSAEAAIRELVLRAARSHGVASLACLRDYYRIRTLAQVRPVVADLVAEGELLPVRVEGWDVLAYLHKDAAIPATVRARTVLSPFDPLVWHRDRAEALFDFFYRIEIYTPAAKRQYGYYVLPFLLGERIVGRVDLKADRASARLLVKGSYAEPEAPPEVAEQLAAELNRVAQWLRLTEVVVEPRGDLASQLAVAVGQAEA